MTVLLSGCCTPRKAGVGERTRFIGLKDFSKFAKAGSASGEVVLTSPEIAAPIKWDELIVSWNVAADSYAKIEARGIYPDHATKFYTIGLWSENPAQHPRESVARQRDDDDGTVKTDTLVLSSVPGASVQLRVTLGSTTGQPASALKFLGLSFCNSKAKAAPASAKRAAWGKALDVPERRQGEYAKAAVVGAAPRRFRWCWRIGANGCIVPRAEPLKRFLEVAEAINDPVFDGTGNWPFNTAYAGAFPGLRAYVTRLNDVSELEKWIAAGVPVIISVSSYLINNRTSGPGQWPSDCLRRLHGRRRRGGQ